MTIKKDLEIIETIETNNFREKDKIIGKIIIMIKNNSK